MDKLQIVVGAYILMVFNVFLLVLMDLQLNKFQVVKYFKIKIIFNILYINILLASFATCEYTDSLALKSNWPLNTMNY